MLKCLHTRPIFGVFKPVLRQMSTIRISEEVCDALREKKPVVALESTIITHGLPFPQNIEMAQQVESTIRSQGVVPATIAFVAGRPCVGLSKAEVEMLASQEANKVSRRDIAYTMAHRLNGGTTISGTMILAEKAGIKVFATGGLGGAHKGSHLTFDVSADLTELGRTKVAVVCAGPKSILDIPKTLEYLETQGCFVGTLGPVGTNIPGFFTMDSGVASPYNFSSFKDAAQIVNEGINSLGLESGYLLCIPPPASVALDSRYMSQVIAEAEREADQLGIYGKQLTPFLLSRVAKLTEGSSVDTNLQVVFNNAKAGARIAIELSRIENEKRTMENEGISRKESLDDKVQPEVQEQAPKKVSTKINKRAAQLGTDNHADVAVVGSVAVDQLCNITGEHHLGDSFPGDITTSIGGVGYNVALAASYGSDSISVRLIAKVGADTFGQLIKKELESKKLDLRGVVESNSEATAKYVSMHDSNGELIIACADMNIAENFAPEEVVDILTSASPRIVSVDGNIGVEALCAVHKYCLTNNCVLVFEPTSSPKAVKVAQLVKNNPYPFVFTSSHLPALMESGADSVSGLVLTTPTVTELRKIHDQLEIDDLFDVDYWFPVLDAIGIDSDFRNKLGAISDPFLKTLLTQGVFQQAFKVLPYIPCLTIKLGKEGVLMVNLTTKAHKIKDAVNYHAVGGIPKVTLVSRGKAIDEHHQLGVVVQWFGIPAKIVKVVNATGAGDAFAGYLISKLAFSGSSMLFEPGPQRNQAIETAQKAAALCLQSGEAITAKIKQL